MATIEQTRRNEFCDDCKTGICINHDIKYSRINEIFYDTNDNYKRFHNIYYNDFHESNKKCIIEYWYDMKEKKFNTPILFIIFNRPDTTDIVFAEIKKIRPKKLFIAADGPRKNVPEDYKKCAKTRELIKKIDWSCDVKTLFQKVLDKVC